MSPVEVCERAVKAVKLVSKRPEKANRYIYGSKKFEKTFFW